MSHVGPAPEWDRSLQDLTLGSRLRLEELVDREALGEVVRSFHALFGIALRIFSGEGALLAEAGAEQAICRYLASLSRGKVACLETVDRARRAEVPDTGEVVHACFTGAEYRISPITYDGRRLGKAVLGPFLPAEVTTVPASLLSADAAVDPMQARLLLPRMPRAKAETMTLIADHLKRTLDLILFSGHKTLLTTQMHLASVRESYRELSDKNQKLQEAYDRLKELDRLKSDFLGTVSHELRTPLTSVIGYSEMLASGMVGDLTSEQLDFIRIIHEKGNQLLALILDLLDLSKLESGTMTVRKGSVAIGAVVEDVLQTLAPKAKMRSVALEREVARDLPEIVGDKDRIQQVLLNLVDNAIKFSFEGSTVKVVASITSIEDGDEHEGLVVLRPSRRSVEVQVVDQGIGIPLAERDRIFDPFYQVDSGSTRQYEGSGLGLSIVKRLVDAHGGKVQVTGNVPQGSIFSVQLPVGDKRPLG